MGKKVLYIYILLYAYWKRCSDWGFDPTIRSKIYFSMIETASFPSTVTYDMPCCCERHDMKNVQVNVKRCLEEQRLHIHAAKNRSFILWVAIT